MPAGPGQPERVDVVGEHPEAGHLVPGDELTDHLDHDLRAAGLVRPGDRQLDIEAPGAHQGRVGHAGAEVDAYPAEPGGFAAPRPRRAISHHMACSRSSATWRRNATTCWTVHTATAASPGLPCGRLRWRGLGGVQLTVADSRTRGWVCRLRCAVGVGRRVTPLLDNLRRDPSLRYNEAGRALLGWLTRYAGGIEQWREVLHRVPPHCVAVLADLAGPRPHQLATESGPSPGFAAATKARW